MGKITNYNIFLYLEELKFLKIEVNQYLNKSNKSYTNTHNIRSYNNKNNTFRIIFFNVKKHITY